MASQRSTGLSRAHPVDMSSDSRGPPLGCVADQCSSSEDLWWAIISRLLLDRGAGLDSAEQWAGKQRSTRGDGDGSFSRVVHHWRAANISSGTARTL